MSIDSGTAGSAGADQKQVAVLRLGWQRLLVIVAAIWAIPVFAYTGIAISSSLEAESDVQRRWVVAKLYLVEEFYGRGPGDESAAAKRQRFYGDASDEEIIRSTDAPLGEDHANRIPIDRIRTIEREYDGHLWLRQHRPTVVGIGFLYWLTPVAVLFLLGNAVAAMYLSANAIAGRLRRWGNAETRALPIDTGDRRTSAPRVVRLLARGSLIPVAGFYLASMIGWAFAWYAVSSGIWHATGDTGTRFEAAWQSLTALDHAVRVAQVVIISAASALLVFGKRTALPLMLVAIVFATLSTFAMPQWDISFLSGRWIVVLMLVVGHVHWLERRGLLR